ncbi:unnamed protein product [Ostreobium quekettii]|uniref:Glycerophosphocholine acyltransferase 1 n=1 Tax=Ostreobium quekettii TaxID=121088 RepID=A0A8S1IS44_9CHLO|nr:unnamed protein product [Ostreobium quekettii]|eukprot:evm.model.scf_614.6 EVM.evm.TU.scf_614.6   scf_614:33115-38639(+)
MAGDAEFYPVSPSASMERQDSSVEELSSLQLAVDTLAGFQDVLDHHQAQDGDAFKSGDYEEFDVGNFDFRVRSFLKQQLKKHLFKVTHKRVLFGDKIAFMLGTVNLWLGAYWLGCCRETFYKLYTVKAAVLFTTRFLMYKQQKMHYYFFDFCYFANGLLLFYLWVMPTSVFLLKVCFAYNTGIMAWSILAFRNSLVFHSLDKVTSLFLHYEPMLVAWTLRWYPHCEMLGSCRMDVRPSHGNPTWEQASAADLLLYPIPLYLLWAIIYYLKIFVFSERKIQEREYATLFKYMTSNKKSGFAKFILSFQRRWQPVVFLGFHLTFFVVALVFVVFCWRTYWVHTALIIALSCVSVWNGANFYFEVFATKYMKTVETRVAEKKED